MQLSSIAMTAGATVVVGLNGALQKRFVLPSGVHLVAGNVHRAADVQVGVGGKGQDVAVALNCLRCKKENSSSSSNNNKNNNMIKLAQFVGSNAEGNEVYDMLRDMLGDGAVAELTVRTASGMRTCTSIVASDSTTELVEPSGRVEDGEMEQFMNKLRYLEEGVRVLCIMGTMPPGCGVETYASIYKAVAGKNTMCLVDSVVGTEPLLRAISESNGCGGDNGPIPTAVILKMNASELCRLSNAKKTTASEVGGVRASELVVAVSNFFLSFHPHAKNAVTAVAITDGPHAAYLAYSDDNGDDCIEFRLFQLPIVDLSEQNGRAPTTLFPIGAGDAVAAGTIAAWRQHADDTPSSCSSTSFTESNDDKDIVLDESVVSALRERMEQQKQQTKEGGSTKTTWPLSQETALLLNSFQFGLACGTASCLQEQNSVLDVQDALRFYRQMKKPTFLSSHKIPHVQER